MKPIRYTDHAHKKMQEREIGEEDVEAVVREPSILLPSRSLSRNDVIGYVRGRALRVAYAESQDALWIITSYWVAA